PGLHTLSECCFKYRNSPIRLTNLVDFYKTPEECFYKAIVFETKKGIKICVNPKVAWVKQAVEMLQVKKELHA
ncbi:CCL3 protein, partial [Podilymbus podiceps]|nr:CCL3 protein [Podilymbus podiceps]